MDVRIGSDIQLAFPYDRSTVEKCKTIPCHVWDPTNKVWRFPLAMASYILETFYKELYQAQIAQLSKLAKVPSVSQIEGVNSSLWPYQQVGVGFLMTRGKAILADDRGLGKSIQSFAAAMKLYSEKKIDRIVVVTVNPASMFLHWEHDIRKHTNVTDIKCIWTSNDIIGNNSLVTVINYEKLSNDNVIAWLAANARRTCLILDEVTKIKNYRTQAYQTLASIKEFPYIFMLTGTPVQNSPSELYAYMALLGYNVFGSFTRFRDNYAIMERVYTPRGSIDRIAGWKNLQDLGDKVAPFIIKRTKADVDIELPTKHIMTVPIKLSAEEDTVYKSIVRSLTDCLSLTRDNKTIFTLISALKEFLNSPELLRESDSETLRNIPMPVSLMSSKEETFMEEIDEIMSTKSQVVVFTQYARMAAILTRKINDKFGQIAVQYSGESTNEPIQDFVNGKYRVLVSTDKGAYGIDLTNANFVINYDHPWNPAIIDQRIDRTHRIGQTQKVFVINLLVEDEEKIEQYIENALMTKRAMADEILNNQ